LAKLCGEHEMAKAYGDDLRRKFLLAYDQGEETLEELADRFLVSGKRLFLAVWTSSGFCAG
jgi:hypothetical protein